MALARSSLSIPVRFAFFSLGVLIWTEVSEECEALFTRTSLKQYTAKSILAHPPLVTDQKD
jgi:hypothetical protein